MNCIVCGTEVQENEQHCSKCREMEGKVQVLTLEERQHFSGITLEQDQQQEQKHYEYQSKNANQGIYIKQFSINNTSLLTKLLFAIILAVVLVVALPIAVFFISIVGLILYLVRK